jgi:hypothetical protein
METVGTWQRVFLRKGVGQRRDRLFEEMKDRLVGGIPKWLRQSFKLVPGSVWEAKDPSLANSPGICKFLASEGTALPRV